MKKDLLSGLRCLTINVALSLLGPAAAKQQPSGARRCAAQCSYGFGSPDVLSGLHCREAAAAREAAAPTVQY